MMTHSELAAENFKRGYNCAQAVVLAFADLTDMDEATLSRMSCSFGGGMGRLREVCGTVTGMFLVTGLLRGYDGAETGEVKAAHYARIQALAKEFERQNGSIVCRELLALLPARGIPLTTAAGVITLRQTGGAQCLRESGALGVKTLWKLCCFPAQ